MQEVAERALQFLDDVRRDVPALEADVIEPEDPRGTAADRARVRKRVLRHHRVAADEPVLADAAELVHRRPGADVREVLHGHVAAERRVRPEDGVVADAAIVRDVNVGHEHVAVADHRDAAAAARAAVDGDELAEDVPRPDHEPGGLALVLEILRREADRRERIDLGPIADLGPPVDHRRCADLAIRADAHVRPDARVRTDDGPLANRRARMHDGARIDVGPIRTDAEQQLGLRHDLVTDVRGRLRACQRRPPLAERDLEPQPIAGDHLAPEFRVVHAA